MFRNNLRKKEKGAALLLTLICVALGAVLIATSINYADTMLRYTYLRDERNKAFYAADAGIDDALWCIKNGVPPRATLPQNINGYQVTIGVVDRGDFTIYSGDFVPISGHVDWMHITEMVNWTAGASAYKYVITITRDPLCSGNITLHEVGARIPPGYSYERCNVGDNLSQGNPSITYDGQGAQLLKWVFDSPRPQLDETQPTASQSFYFTGSGELSGYYSWVIAARNDIGTISMIQGDVYIITARAVSPLDGKIKGTVICDAMLTTGKVLYILRWQIGP